MSDTASSRILDLLDYIEQVEKLKSKPAFTVPTEYFVAYQHELKGLPGVRFNLTAGGEDVWLALPRLQEVNAPALAPELLAWVTLSRSTEKRPELKAEIPLYENNRPIGMQRLAEQPEVKRAFDAYVQDEWEPWAAAERPRRKTIAVYNKLFSLQQAIAAEGAETPVELVWGIGMGVWKKDGTGQTVRHPLLVQACEVTLDAKTFELQVRPREVEARLEVDCYTQLEVPGVPQLEAYWKANSESAGSRVNPFEHSTFETVLRQAVGHLDPAGSYLQLADGAEPPAPTEKLKVTNGWVLFARKRSGDIFLEDVRRLKKNVQRATSLPAVIRGFVERGDEKVRPRTEQPFRGLSQSDMPAGAFELYFPKPYNDEQVSIVQKLHSSDGVVVQGPPGTGKTHTIANVVSHYLALGKRVLVTAKSEAALAVLQEKLPEEIRPLSVSLLSNERDGMKQFEHSIQMIADRVAGMNPGRVTGEVQNAEERLNQLHAQIAETDRRIAALAAVQLKKHSFGGQEVTAEQMAKFVLEQAAEHEWLDDEPPEANTALPFTDADVQALRQARRSVGKDLAYLGVSLPVPDDFPAWAQLLELHRDLVKARSIDTALKGGALLSLVDTSAETFEQAQALLGFLRERSQLREALEQASQTSPWLKTFRQRLAVAPADDPVLTALFELGAEVSEREAERRALLPHALVVPPAAEKNEDFVEALPRLAAGKSAFALPFGKSEARKLVVAVTVGGSQPDTQGWARVAQLVRWRQAARQLLARWRAMAGEFGLPLPEGEEDSAFRSIAAAQVQLEQARRLTYGFDAQMQERVQAVFGDKAAHAMAAGGHCALDSVVSSLEAHVDRGRLASAMRRWNAVRAKLDGHGGAIVRELRQILVHSLDRSDVDETSMQTSWADLQLELARLNGLRPMLEEVARVADLIESAGAPRWAERLRTTPATAQVDEHAPSAWLEAWNWRRALMFLERIDAHQKMRTLFEKRRELTGSLARTYQDLIASKTWLAVYENSPPSIRQALQRYLNAVQAMGSGTGIRAVRHRKTAREAMLQAYQAVPCWVLPQWRVSETIPAEVALFDLVIIDEASQSDIWALPALLRGKQLLVVGDHKQVSPSAVGTAEEKIKDLARRFLADQPHGSEMTPDKSIYDLARVVFAGNMVTLKEHFRCVPAIIEFSNREFYQGDIRPLRLPRANERLDPPLIDVFVKGGMRRKDTNPAEAKAIVDEIEAMLEDETLRGRTIGVVTLMGNEQAALIHELVSRRIPPEKVVEHEIRVGPPSVFQGSERDIMLVSMVLAPGNRAAANKLDMQQRFNVALSRARDRMILFRSVPETEFAEDTLNGKVIRHFRAPFRQDARKVEELRSRCESGFEREMFDWLVARGYRVEPQVGVGGYRIDFVVEGSEGRRLAIECDGDAFHGPGQWSDDMARQRVLERAGWTFWRCFASSFVRRREEVLDDLAATLGSLGIEPLGAESVDNTVWVHSKVVDPFGIDSEETDEFEVQSEGPVATAAT